MSNFDREFARLLGSVEKPPANNVQALGHLMREWLKAAVADAGTAVDCGGGMGGYDLWVKVEGREVFITLRDSGAQIAKDEEAADAAP